MKPVGLIAIGIVVLMGTFFGLNSYIYNEKQGDGGRAPQPVRVSIVGSYVCLPHVDLSLGTKECAVGMKTDAGVYYVLDLGLVSQTPPEFRVGDRFSANGIVTPSEYLSTDHWQTYDAEGVFSVTDSLVVEK